MTCVCVDFLVCVRFDVFLRSPLRLDVTTSKTAISC